MTTEKSRSSKKKSKITEKEYRKKLKKELTPEQYKVLVNKGTERPFSGKYVYNKDKGTYDCAVCGNPLFRSEDKFKSGTGWPSFDKPFSEEAIETREDRSLGTVRTEVVCGNCGRHLGHLFMDGPTETQCRYCINSVSMDFESKTVSNSKEKALTEKTINLSKQK